MATRRHQKKHLGSSADVDGTVARIAFYTSLRALSGSLNRGQDFLPDISQTLNISRPALESTDPPTIAEDLPLPSSE